MTSKKLLIAGGGYAEIPLILAAKDLGFRVITSGNREKDLGHQFSDQCCLEDFSDKEAMLKLAKSLKIDAICASCNDFSALTAAYVAENLQLAGHDPYNTTLLIHHKDRYREFAQKHGIPSPRAEGFDSIEGAYNSLLNFQFPVIVKPVDLTGGKGISKVTNLQIAKASLEKAFQISRTKKIVIEEFIEGSRHGLSTFIRDGRVVFFFNDNEHYYLNPYLVSAASTPADVSPETATILCKTAEKIASLLKLNTGIFHIQYILRQDIPVIIEICRRAPGDLYIQFVQHATGMEYPTYIVKSSAGMNCDDLTQIEPQGFFTRHCIMPPRNGRIKEVIFNQSVKNNIIDKMMWWKPDEQIDNFLMQKLGIVFLKFGSTEEMRQKTEQMPNLIRVDMA
ncbi:ATP-grasp domain-containing protein [Gimesia fumaroli]|uniref:Carbamoyl-phosphate synthase large chain n=1 Tax=Gimesia fumaroli TaxID=2527976 RepID=A0A518IDS9_9PLAN|nr:ATP-grasp domain-containing protein [Gimesia fumaroli]QDV51210.1 Carbamoyl-phosphate synthase large chain [Gimesia fumaroli]